MEIAKKVVRHGIEISICKEKSGTFTVYFSNTPGTFEHLTGVGTLTGLKDIGIAEEEGIKFVDDHQWEDTDEKIGVYRLLVRHWWNGDWGYSLERGGTIDRFGEFKSKDEAITAGRTRGKALMIKLNKRSKKKILK